MKLFVKIFISVLFALGILLGFSYMISLDDNVSFIQAFAFVIITAIGTSLFYGIVWLIIEMWFNWK